MGSVKRDKCCLCRGPLKFEFTLKDYPVTYGPSETPDFQVEDCDVGSCTECMCIQLIDLIDPSIVYGSFHNTTSFSTVWKNHHDLFTKFIGNKLHGKCLEIGGKSGELVKRIGYPEYYTLDFSNPDDDPKNLKGNCENFDYTGFDCLIMSHVFEHLYNPIDFYENCKVDDIFISIPNVKTDGIIPIHREHTYMCDENYIIKLFKGYSCRLEYFGEHSIFIHLYRTRRMYEDILGKMTELTKLKLNNDYIFPAGVTGVSIIYFSDTTNIKGFIDNDPGKQGKFYMGKQVFKPSEVSSNVYYSHVLYNNDMLQKLIAHRGNTNGPNKELENRPEYIDKALDQGFDVEVDVWVIDNNIFLGHDTPDHPITSSFLTERRNKLWCHAKNLESMTVLKTLDMNAFFHDTDAYVYTTKGFIWAHPTSEFSKDTICVMSSTNPPGCLGYCSDFVSELKVNADKS
jgi:hypothetical protein